MSTRNRWSVVLLAAIILCTMLSVFVYAHSCTDWSPWKVLQTYCKNAPCQINGVFSVQTHFAKRQRIKYCFYGNEPITHYQYDEVVIGCCPNPS